MKFHGIVRNILLVVAAGTAVAQNAPNGQGQAQGRGIRGVTRRTPTVVYGQAASQFFGASGLPLNAPPNNVGVGATATVPGASPALASQRGPVPSGTRPGSPLIAGGATKGGPSQTRPGGPLPTQSTARPTGVQPTGPLVPQASSARR